MEARGLILGWGTKIHMLSSAAKLGGGGEAVKTNRQTNKQNKPQDFSERCKTTDILFLYSRGQDRDFCSCLHTYLLTFHICMWQLPGLKLNPLFFFFRVLF